MSVAMHSLQTQNLGLDASVAAVLDAVLMAINEAEEHAENALNFLHSQPIRGSDCSRIRRGRLRRAAAPQDRWARRGVMIRQESRAYFKALGARITMLRKMRGMTQNEQCALDERDATVAQD